MSDLKTYQRRAFSEAAATYGSDGAAGPHTKLSISLPTPIFELVRSAAAESGLPVSTLISASIQRMLADIEQQHLDRALELDAEENLAWAEAYLPIAAKLWAEIEW